MNDERFRNFVPADLPDGTKQLLCVVPRDEWFAESSTFWSFARSAAHEGWVWVVSTNFALTDVQIVLMYLPQGERRTDDRMTWEVHGGRGVFRLELADEHDKMQ